jgi:F-type H+-transporting ATPase subunit a
LAAGAEPTIDALGQFKLHTVLGPFGASVNFTQSNLLMLVGGALMIMLLWFGMQPRAVVPGRLQAGAELAYKFIYDMSVEQIGPQGRRYFPFVFTLFFFVLMGNLLGLLPYSFTYTSHIAVTFALALTVFVLVTIVAILLHGARFFSYFVPHGAPKLLIPVLVPIEVISYLSRLISLPVRLFANMVAGHVMMEVFATFLVLMASAGAVGIFAAIFPQIVNIILIGFELLVAALQAYVFALLTCLYLHDAVHLH